MAKRQRRAGSSSKRSAVRVGRPPRAMAGEVDDRILDAARRLFLERGLGGASIDEIARLARAGKPTIYARFPTKKALFMAVVMRNAAQNAARAESRSPAGASIEERLVNVGIGVFDRFIDSNAIDLMRLAVGEVRRFPELVNVGRMARERGAEAVMRVLRQVATSDEAGSFPGLAPEHLETNALHFLDLVVGRFQTRALFGEDLSLLRREIAAHVPRAVAFFLAACRQRGDD